MAMRTRNLSYYMMKTCCLAGAEIDSNWVAVANQDRNPMGALNLQRKMEQTQKV
jgi:hypothetical protein